MKEVLTTSNITYMLGGMRLTLEIAVFAGIISIAFGTVLALMKTYCRGALGVFNVIATIYVEIFRCTPQLLWILMFRFFVTGGGLNLGVVSLSIVSAPYICEIVRGGLNNISKGQIEAGYSQGYDFIKILWYIILPQAFRAVIPSLTAQVVSIIKSTSLLASINIFEYLLTCNTVMVNADTIAKMKDGILLINVARGGLFDTQAVLEGLESGKLGAVALDVIEGEEILRRPQGQNDLPILDELMKHENFTFTMHTAFYTDEADRNQSDTTLENFNEYRTTGQCRYELVK